MTQRPTHKELSPLNGDFNVFFNIAYLMNIVLFKALFFFKGIINLKSAV